MEKHVEMQISKINENIYIGTNMCCSTHFEKFSAEGFDVDIDMESERQESPHDVKIYLWLPTKDKEAPTLDQLKAGVALIDRMVESDRKIYVHCMNGHGRGPTMVAAYFIFKKKMNVSEVVEYIRDRRPEIHLEDVQLEQLERYQEYSKSDLWR